MKYDDNEILSKVTLKVTGTLDIARALTETKFFLSGLMPLDEIILVRVDEANLSFHLVIRVSADGVTDKQNQFLFMLDKEDSPLAKGPLARQEDETGVFVRSEIENELRTLDIKPLFQQIGLPANADILVLFDKKIHAGFIAVSYQRDVYTRDHVRLFERLREPFSVALRNAVRFTEVQHSRDILADDNQIFREASVRLTGEQDIGNAFLETLRYLKHAIPIRQIMVITTADNKDDQRILLRVRESGAVDEEEALLFSGNDSNFVRQRERIMEDLPNTFVRTLHEGDFSHISPKEREEKTRQFDINVTDTLIMIGVKSELSGILIVCDKQDAEAENRCVRILKMLKEPFVIALYNAVRFYDLVRLKKHLEDENQALLRDMQRETGDRVIGMHQGLRHVMSLSSKVAKTLSPVLLLGETGSGKEVIATAVHRMSDRAAGPFISINCGAIPESLIDSELFGHERGAFTGANERKRGRFERADQGTLFLDEVGELPLSAQVRLLRVLQEKEFERVGGSQPVRADVRLIAATNRDLPAMVQDGRFREDLWFRLNVFPIEIPPLRERREDIPSLTYHFIETKCRQLNLSFRPALPAESLEKLIAYDWPGNVRELQNAVERALILSRGEPLRFPYLTLSALPEASPKKNESAPQSMPTFEEVSRAYFRSLLNFTHGRIAGPKGAAAVAKLNPSTLRSKLRKLGVAAFDD